MFDYNLWFASSVEYTYEIYITFFFLKGKFYLEDPTGTIQLNLSKAISFPCVNSVCTELQTPHLPTETRNGVLAAVKDTTLRLNTPLLPCFFIIVISYY